VKLVEIDTRHTHDSEILVYHSPSLSTLTTGRGLIAELPLADIMHERFIDTPTEHIARLQEYLDIIAKTDALELWIDIKDYGLEDKYVSLIKNHSLCARVRLISWIPETLLRLHALAPDIRLGFSYCCSANHPYLHAIVRWIAIHTRRQSVPIAANHRRGRSADMFGSILHFHPICSPISQFTAPSYPAGYNHSHVIPGLPPHPVRDILRSNHGAIGMFPSQATPELVAEAHQAGLLVYIYCIDKVSKLSRFLRSSPVDVVFTNNPDMIISHPTVEVSVQQSHMGGSITISE
jgi:glycerophosphoryl diester phosphodiesterase